ncbi:hypothetical protein [Microbulbifer sp. TYP-18]|uniref:hypothetical protein n=1 Tax=Microbulbifer sp. TYP-18 TaxID=3230024 RepID=UPI0034C641E1
MEAIPASFSPIQLHDRLNRPVWLGFKRVPVDGRELLFLTSGSGSVQIGKNFETFAGQIVREFDINPADVDFVELRDEDERRHWYRWHAQWVGSAPMECRAEAVTGESRRRYLDQALHGDTVAA